MRARLWILAAVLTAGAGTMWYRGRDVLMTEAEIRAAVPADLRYAPPTAQEAKVEEDLRTLANEVFLDANLQTAWIVGNFERSADRYQTLLDHSGWVRDRVERLAPSGPGAMSAEPGAELNEEGGFGDIPRVLALRCDFGLVDKRPIGRDVLALARYLRLRCLQRGGRGSVNTAFTTFTCLQTVHRALDAGALSRVERQALYKILPADAEMIAVQQDRIRYELATQVVYPLRPIGVHAILNPKLKADDYRQYVIGRLDVPSTLRDQIEATRGAMAIVANGTKDPRFTKAVKSRNEILGDVPWKKDGESEVAHRMREIAYRIRLAFHPNPRGALVGLGRLSWSPYQHELDERSGFALARARLQIELGEKGSLPIDPWSNRPMRYDPRRKIVWSYSSNRRDDGGTVNRQTLALPDLVASVR